MREWATVEAQLSAQAREQLTPSLTAALTEAWSRWPLHDVPPALGDNVFQTAPLDVQTYHTACHAALRGSAELDPCFERVLDDLSVALPCAVALQSFLATEAQTASPAVLAAMSGTLERHAPSLLDVLFVLVPPGEYATLLAQAVSSLDRTAWHSVSAVTVLSPVLLCLTYLATCARQPLAGGAAQALLSAAAPCLAPDGWPAALRACLDRWTAAVLGQADMDDSLCAQTPPWAWYALAPSVCNRVLAAYDDELVDRHGALQAIARWAQPPWHVALPVVLTFLLTDAERAWDEAQYGRRPAHGAALRVVMAHRLTAAPTCTPLMRATVATPWRAFAHTERLLALASASGVDAAAWLSRMATPLLPLATPPEAVIAALQRERPDVRASSTMLRSVSQLTTSTTSRPRDAAYQLVDSALHAADDAWGAELLAAALAYLGLEAALVTWVPTATAASHLATLDQVLRHSACLRNA